MPAALWDLDGTLVDSTDYHFQSWIVALGAEGRTLTREQFTETFGQRNDRILAGWLGTDLPPEVPLRIADSKERAYRQLVQERGIQPLPGASKWVNWLRANGWTQAIASSAPRLNVEIVIETLGWHSYFGAIVAAEDVSAGKPNPEVFLTAAERVGVPPARCVVIEDAAAGIEAARRAGMRSIGIGSSAAAGDPDVHVSSLVGLEASVWESLSS